MIALALALLLQAAESGPWTKHQSDQLGRGPHTLVISDGEAMTRIDYPSGAQCKRARDEVRRQTAPPPDRPGVYYGPSRTTAFCVPR